MTEYDSTIPSSDGLRVLSLCGGIETGLLALLDLGIPIAEYHTYEILPEAIAVSKKHFPWIVHHGNLFDADFSQYKGFDLVIGGMCCESLSRIRIEDKAVNNGLLGKSGIVYELQKAIDIIQPQWFMSENVIPSNKEDLDKLNEIMGVEGILLNSNQFSVQDRERYYWTNIPIRDCFELNTQVFGDVMEKNVIGSYFYDKPFKILDMDKKVCAQLCVNSMEISKRIYNPKFKMATLTCIRGGYQEKKVLDNGRPRKLTEVEYERCQGIPDNFTNVTVNNRKMGYSKRCSLLGNAWNLPTVEYIFSGLKLEDY